MVREWSLIWNEVIKPWFDGRPKGWRFGSDPTNDICGVTVKVESVEWDPNKKEYNDEKRLSSYKELNVYYRQGWDKFGKMKKTMNEIVPKIIPNSCYVIHNVKE